MKSGHIVKIKKLISAALNSGYCVIFLCLDIDSSVAKWSGKKSIHVESVESTIFHRYHTIHWFL